jgi:aminoglycoside phosphotransferase (APT) family kinase protein
LVAGPRVTFRLVLNPSLDTVLPPGAKIIDVVPRTGGTLSAVHEVRLADGDPLIVKQYSDEWRWKQAKEVHVYELLAKHGVGPAPRVVGVDEPRGITVLTLVPGKPMSETRLSLTQEREAYRRMGALLAGLHRITMPAFGYLTTEIIDPRPDNPTYMGRQFARNLADFVDQGGSAKLHHEMFERVAAQASLFASCARAVLCHNDFHEGNVLVDGAGVVTGFIDVENMIAADPLMDLAKTLQYDRDRSPEKRAALLDGYGTLPADAAPRLELYRLYHSLELWAWFASIGKTEPLDGIAEDIRRLI